MVRRIPTRFISSRSRRIPFFVTVLTQNQKAPICESTGVPSPVGFLNQSAKGRASTDFNALVEKELAAARKGELRNDSVKNTTLPKALNRAKFLRVNFIISI
jgi:hypothetical protein